MFVCEIMLCGPIESRHDKRTNNTVNLFQKFIPTVEVEAHCDIPCGIYDPTPAKMAAMTVLKMTHQLKELGAHEIKDAEQVAMVARRVKVKEEHAELCKRELQILWSDFFKPEHLAKTPNLHDMFWKALKLGSQNKQEINEDEARALVAAVDEIAKVFYEAKGDAARFEAYKKVTDALV